MYNKKALRTIVKNLDKAKAPAKPKDIIVDPMGQWKYPGQKTRIPGGDITMQGVSYPVWAQPNVGTGQLMQPGQDYKFPGADYVDETPMAKKGGVLKKYSRSLEAKNKIFADNPLTKKPKSKKKKIFDPTSKYYKNGGVNETPSLPLKAGRDVYETFAYGLYDRPGWKRQEGGVNRTNLTPEEETHFQKFYNTLPDNLMSDDPTYDIRGYWDSEGRPESFNYDQPKEEDGYYHAYSINGNTGEYLKSPTHDTFQHAIDEDRKIGYRPITNVYGRNIATENKSIADPEEQSFLRNTEGPTNYIETELTDDEIQAYREGGYVVEDLEDNTYQQGGYFSYGDKKYMKKDGKWLVDLNGKYVPLSKNVAQRSAVLDKQAKYVKPAPVTKSQYQLDQEAKRANYFNPDYSVLPNIKQQVAESAVPVISYDKGLQKSRAVNDKKDAEREAQEREETRLAVLYDPVMSKEQRNQILMDPRKLAEHRYLGEHRMYGNPNEVQINNKPKSAPQGMFSKGLDVMSNPFTALTAMGSAEGLPDYLQKNLDRGTFAYTKNGAVHTERNPFDYAVDFTPLGLINDARNVYNGIAEGDWGKVGWGLAGAVPGVSELRSAGKAVKAVDKIKDVAKPLGKAVKPISKNVKRATELYSGVGQGTINKYSPLNLIKGYGSKLENPTVPLGNVLEDAANAGNVTLSKGPISKAYNAVRGKPNPVMTAAKKATKNNKKSIFQLEVNPNAVGTKVKYMPDANTRWNPLAAKKYNLKYGREAAREIPLSDPGVTLKRRLPFSNKFVNIDPIRLANNQSQWATRGTGLQNIAEKYGSTVAGMTGLGLASTPAITYYFNNRLPTVDDYKNIGSAMFNAHNPYNYFAKPDYKGIAGYYTIGTGGRNLHDDVYNTFKQTGGAIEMDADEDMINYLRSQGYTVEDVD